MAFLGEKNNIFEGWLWDDSTRFFSLKNTEWTPRRLTTRHQIEVVELRIRSIYSALGNKISLVDPQGQLADLIAEKARLIWMLTSTPQQTAQTLQ